MQRELYFCLLLLLLLTSQSEFIAAYQIEQPRLELIDNTKFRLTLEDDPDIKWVQFSVNINKPFESYEEGQMKCTAGIPQRRLWSCEFSRPLQDQDIVYTWLAVKHNHLTHRAKKNAFNVGALRRGERNYILPLTTTTPSPDEDYADYITYAPAPQSPTETSPPPTDDVKQGSTSTSVTTTGKCAPTISVVENGGTICLGQVIFEDEFDRFMSEYWTNEIRIPTDKLDSEFAIYNGSVGVNDGMLKITATLSGQGITDPLDLNERCTASNKDECMYKFRLHHFLPPIVSGRLNTAKYFNFKYGRIEVRARTPIGDWLYPLITLQTSRDKYGSNAYANGEMRIAFVRGNPVLMSDGVDIGGTRLFGGPIFSINANERHKYMSNVTLPDKEQFGEKFHTYSLTWKPDELLLSVDNYQYGRIPINSDDSARVPSQRKPGIVPPLDQMFYITLGLAVGGHGDFTDNIENKPWENTNTKAIVTFYEGRDQFLRTWKQPSLEVDYVRVFAI